MTDTSHLSSAARLGSGPEGHALHRLTVTDTSGQTDTGTCDTFEELSKAIDAAMASPGFARYEVGPAGDR